MALQLPSPPETLTESLANAQSTLGSSTEYDASTSKLGGRFDAQFPSTLGPGRVPPHRRGTSKTYERMEDLLRETGYGGTRVFTPETERAEAEAEKRKERTLRRAASVRSGVDAVVGFISGLVSRASAWLPMVVCVAPSMHRGRRRLQCLNRNTLRRHRPSPTNALFFLDIHAFSPSLPSSLNPRALIFRRERLPPIDCPEVPTQPLDRSDAQLRREYESARERPGSGAGDDGDEGWHSVAAGWDKDGAKAKVAGGLGEGIFFGGDGAAGPRKRTRIASTWAQRNVEA